MEKRIKEKEKEKGIEISLNFQGAAIFVACFLAARWLLAPSFWWCVLNEVGRTRRINSGVLALAFLPHAFAMFWVAEAVSFYGEGVGRVVAAPCFCWAHGVALPRVVATQKWGADLKRRSRAKELVAGLVVVGHFYLLLYGLTWSGCLGMLLWARKCKK